MPEITVDYFVPVTVRVDTDTDTVKAVYAHLADFNGVIPEGYFNEDDDSLPNELPADHPVAVKAEQIASSIRPRVGDVAILWEKR